MFRGTDFSPTSYARPTACLVGLFLRLSGYSSVTMITIYTAVMLWLVLTTERRNFSLPDYVASNGSDTLNEVPGRVSKEPAVEY
jgi:hypothetical protein